MSEEAPKKQEKKLPPCTIRIRRMVVNRLMQRKQFVVQILHPGRRSVSKAELTELLAKMFKVTDPKTIFTYGFKTDFGGGRTVGFGLIYENLQVAKRFEPKYRQLRQGIIQKPEKPLTRKVKKDARKKAKKQWGTRVKKSKDEKK